MSDERLEIGERHTPEEWVAELGLDLPVLESVLSWCPSSEEAYATDPVTKPRFMEVYVTAIRNKAAKPGFSLQDCKQEGRVHLWFVGEGELEIIERSDRATNATAQRQKLSPDDVELVVGRLWERALVKPDLGTSIQWAAIGDRLLLSTRKGLFETPKIKRIVVTKGDER